jgi:multidrug resistance efflux pump
MPEECYFIKSKVLERIFKIYVKEGDSVKKGDLLLVLGDTIENAQLTILKNKVELAKKDVQDSSSYLTEIRHKVSMAYQKYEYNMKNATRFKELSIDNAVSKKEADEMILIANNSLSDYNILQQQYIMQKRSLENHLLEAENNFIEAYKKHQEKIFKSQISGVVYDINFKEGDVVNINEPILMIASPHKNELELFVDERDITRINIKQKIYFELASYNNQQFEAEITEIIPVLQKESRNFKIYASVRDSLFFYPYSSVEANIIIKESKKLLMIPIEYLQPDSSVLKIFDKEITKTKVVVGIKDDNWCEIINGLKVKDKITK